MSRGSPTLGGGGRTPARLDAVLPLADRIRALVDAGTPYAGFSAGTAVAARRARVGGRRHDDAPVVDEEVGEELDARVVRDGLGLTDLTLDVHAAERDEAAALVLEGAPARVAGSGKVWRVEPGGDGVVVRRQRAAR